MMHVYDLKGNKQGTIEITFNKKKIVPSAYACAIKVLRQNWRQGTVSCKARGEVAFSGKKPWKQKGTGRARVGTRSSPIWRKGGVVFGPQARTRTLKITRKQRFLVFNNVFQFMYEAGNVSCLDLDLKDKVSSKSAFEALKSMGMDTKRVILFAHSSDDATVLSFRNLPNVNLLAFDEPNAYSLTYGQQWVVLKKDIKSFKEMASRWN